jgi:putative ABC transport system substrate-binding protein
MNRRALITLIGGAAATSSLHWPLVARAQQPAIVGFLSGASAWEYAHLAAAFRQGLADASFVEGRNLFIEYRWAEGHYERLPSLAAELVGRRVSVIVATGGVSAALAAKAATASTPIVFANGGDPVKFGLVTSVNSPEANITGVNFINNALASKRLQVLRDVAPNAATVGVVVNPNNPSTEFDLADIRVGAASLGVQIVRVNVGSERDFDNAIARLVEQRVGALIVNSDVFFFTRRAQLIELAARLAVPAIFELREFVMAGGLMSYGTNIAEAYRKAGVYTGRILRGEKPRDLPVQQSTRFELVVNLKTAKTLGIAIPPTMLALADEVIE